MEAIFALAVFTISESAELSRFYLPVTSPHFKNIPNPKLTELFHGFELSPIIVPELEYNEDYYNEKLEQNNTVNNTFSNVFDYEDEATKPKIPQPASEGNAKILNQESENDENSFSFSFQTENEIQVQQTGEAKDGVKVKGGYSYRGSDGRVLSVTYTADENGFVPTGDHLPTDSPIPDEILKALESNAKDEASGIFDDGKYDENKYGDLQYINKARNFDANSNDKYDETEVVDSSKLVIPQVSPPTTLLKSSKENKHKQTQLKVHSLQNVENTVSYLPPILEGSLDDVESLNSNTGLPTSYDVPLQSRTLEDDDEHLIVVRRVRKVLKLIRPHFIAKI